MTARRGGRIFFFQSEVKSRGRRTATSSPKAMKPNNPFRDERCTPRGVRHDAEEERLRTSEIQGSIGRTPAPGLEETTAVRWIYVCLAWAVVAVVFSTQNVVGALASGADIDWAWAVYHEILYWAIWAALTPVILHGASRHRLGTDAGWRPWTAHLVLAIVIAPLHIALAYGLHGASLVAVGALSAPTLPQWLMERRVGFLVISLTGIWKYAIVVGVYYAFDYYRRWRREREQSAALALRTARLEGQLASSRLSALRAQLRPHFLFNTLNSIAVLVRDSPEKAEATIRKLSGLLRDTLERQDVEEVALAEELTFVERYMEIQRIRYEERLEVNVDVDPRVRDLRVPFLLLQPLVENAVRHGVDDHPGGGIVTIRARLDEDRLRLTVQDRPMKEEERTSVEQRRQLGAATSGTRTQASHDPRSPDPDGVGRGLANVRERLEQLYPEDHGFEVTQGPAGGFVVNLHLPGRRADTTQDVDGVG